MPATRPAIFFALFVSTLCGCAGENAPTARNIADHADAPKPAEAFDASVNAVGRWEHVTAAAIRAARLGEMTIEWVEQTSETTTIYHLLTIRNEPARLVVQDRGDHIQASARIGHFGDAPREARLLDVFKTRLEALRSGKAVP
ncbi:MAG: hypothetical protein KAS72_12515 [Phycisphaerales bacterium]|nr:hypothetical protein [Phycisphaerales bacterium]